MVDFLINRHSKYVNRIGVRRLLRRLSIFNCSPSPQATRKRHLGERSLPKQCIHLANGWISWLCWLTWCGHINVSMWVYILSVCQECQSTAWRTSLVVLLQIGSDGQADVNGYCRSNRVSSSPNNLLLPKRETWPLSTATTVETVARIDRVVTSAGQRKIISYK